MYNSGHTYLESTVFVIHICRCQFDKRPTSRSDTDKTLPSKMESDVVLDSNVVKHLYFNCLLKASRAFPTHQTQETEQHWSKRGGRNLFQNSIDLLNWCLPSKKLYQVNPHIVMRLH